MILPESFLKRLLIKEKSLVNRHSAVAYKHSSSKLQKLLLRHSIWFVAVIVQMSTLIAWEQIPAPMVLVCFFLQNSWNATPCSSRRYHLPWWGIQRAQFSEFLLSCAVVLNILVCPYEEAFFKLWCRCALNHLTAIWADYRSKCDQHASDVSPAVSVIR